MGADGVSVTEPGDIAGALDWAVAKTRERRIPILVEILAGPEENAAMGKSIDPVREFEPVDDHDAQAAAPIPELPG